MIEFDFSKLTGIVITKDDFEYEESRKSWNRAIQKYPLVFVYCKNKKDVKNAIIWARNKSLPIRIRSGSHNYEGFSTGNDVVVIDISNMNEININEEKNIVTIQGGVRNREMYEAMGSRNYPFPGGGCPTVGVVGLTLGGGWGYSGRLLGLACDSLLEVEMIDYRGNTIIANKDKNEDLFWASKGGGGGNFGIVVSMTFKIPDKIEKATLINIDFPNIDIIEQVNLVEAWQNFYKDLDRRINLKMGIYNSAEKGKGIKMTGLFYGSKEEANNILKPFMNITSGGEFFIEYMPVLEANRIIQDSHPDYEKYKSAGRFVYKDYNKQEIKEIINLVSERAEGSVYTAVSFYGFGGAIKDIDKSSTAFPYRDAKFIMGFQSVWEDQKYAELNREWVVAKFEYINKITNGAFINFPLAELNSYEEEYYSINIDRLRRIKAKYDPEDIFSFPQSIQGA